MKILAIGDPHGNMDRLKKINYGGVDLILLPGDIGNANLIRKMAYGNINRKREGLPEIEYSKKEEKEGFMQVYNSTIETVRYLSEFAPVYLIFGNVELSNIKTEEDAKKKGKKIPFLAEDLNAMKNVKVINGKIIEFKGVKIGDLKYFIDSSWVEEFESKEDEDYDEKMKNAVKDTQEAKEILDSFSHIDILMCHQPPNGVLDIVKNPGAPKHWQGKHAGSETILKYINEFKPKYVLCGHIHEGRGEDKIGESNVYNLGCCGDKIIEIDD